MENKRIPNNYITASHYIRRGYAHLARLHGNKAWCTRGARDAFLQIRLGTLHQLTAIAAQGSWWDWVPLTPYKVEYEDRNRLKFYKESGREKVIFMESC